MQTFADWIQFSVSSAVVLLLLCVVVLLLVLILKKKNKTHEEQIEAEHLNKKWEKEADQLRLSLLNPPEVKVFLKERAKAEKEKSKTPTQRKRIFVIDFEGDPAATQCASMRDKITTVVAVARANDEVVVRIESPGGLVHSYGLAASQIARLRQRNIHVTACVDKVAASGGYMMACVANKIVAAPFSVVGSIGVIIGMPNLNRLLKKHDIDYVEQTAGENKRNVSLFGELTEDKKAKQQAQLNSIHELFKNHVAQFRPQVDISKVSTGDIWLGTDALKEKLVDEISTSDDLLLKLGEEADIYLLKSEEKMDFKTKLIKKFLGRHSNAADMLFPLSHHSNLGIM